MAPPAERKPFTDDDYAWVMHWAKRGGPEDPDDRGRYRELKAHLNERPSPREHVE